MGFWNKTVKKDRVISPRDSVDVFRSITANKSIIWGGYQKQNLSDYLEVPEVNSIINAKARAFSSMRLEVVSKETGKPVKNNEPLVKALRNPNYFQSQKEFLMQTKIFQEIFGNEIIYFLTPVGFKNNIKGMFTLPPLLVDIDETDRRPYWEQSEWPAESKYFIDWDGKRITLPSTDIIHINNSNVKVEPGNVFWGQSQLSALSGAISNIRAAYEARNVLIENRGALGILSNSGTDGIGASLPLDPKEKEKVQKEWKKGYGLMKDKNQIIITSLPLKWQQMSIDADKLGLFEETKADTEQICDMFGYPFELLANQKGTTFENQKQAEKRFYTNTIIPEANEWVSGMNRRFETMDKSWELKASFEHLDVFRENEKDRAQSITVLINGLSKAYQDQALTLEQYKRELEKLNIGM
jgi:HK97 family phage portal protein